jgi:hypothetical protein
MDLQHRLRQVIDLEHDRLRADVLPDRQAVLLALLRAIDQLPHDRVVEDLPDLVTGRRLANLGGNKALQLCLEAAVDEGWEGRPLPDADEERWAVRFLEECARVAEAELVLGHCETGFMRLVEDDDGFFMAWIATKRAPTSWRERADIDRWAAWLANRDAPELLALHAERPTMTSSDQERDKYYGRLANMHLNMLAYQLGYPPEAVIDGCSVRTYCDVLRLLIAWALREHDRGEAAMPRAELDLTTTLATALKLDPAVISRAVDDFTLGRENAAYHAAVPGVAAAPLVRVGGDRIALSVFGLTTEPLFFLTRELRRRNAQDYHNTAYLREN